MKRIIVHSILLIISILWTSGSALALLKKGEPFKPFSLIATDQIQYTVTLESGRLTVTKLDPADGTRTVFHPDAVLIDFWATWCVPCRKAMPFMQRLHDKYSPKPGSNEGGLILLGIALDKRGSKIVKPFLSKLEYDYPMLSDPIEETIGETLILSPDKMKSEYKVQGIPVVYLFDSKGIIHHVHTGYKKQYEAEIENAVIEITERTGK